MVVFAIPVEDRYIIYRPLRRLAFVGNRALAELALHLADRGTQGNSATAMLDAGLPDDVIGFLKGIGFFEPDGIPPPAPDGEFKPTAGVLLLTNRCHLRCVYCYANAGVQEPQDLRWEFAQNLIDEVCSNALRTGQERYTLSFHGGGEPVMAWSLIKRATAYARTRPLPCTISLTSNGVWSERQAHWIINNLDSVSLSVDGSLQTQDEQRPFLSGGGSSSVVMRAISVLDAAHFPYGIRMTATAPFRDKLPDDMAFLCRATKCEFFQVEPAFNAVRGTSRQPDFTEAGDFIDGFLAAYEIAMQFGRRLTYSGARPWQLTDVFCNAPYAALIVNPSGRLVSCYEVTDERHPLADISQLGQVVDGKIAVDSVKRDRLLGLMAERRTLCRDCFCRWHCAGDCYVRTFGSNGDQTALGVRCHMNRTITANLLLWLIMQGEGVWQGQHDVLTSPMTSPIQDINS